MIGTPPFLTRVVNWLRAGYPNGIPDADYVPLLAILARRLSDDEVRQVAAELRASDTIPSGKTDIGVEITKITDDLPRREDIERVRARLTAADWPTDD